MSYKLADGIEVQELESNLFMFLENGDVGSLDSTGKIMLDLICESNGLDDIVKKVASFYSVDELVAKADIEKLVGELTTYGFLEAS